MATHSSILAWEIPWKRSLVGCSTWGCNSLTWLSNWATTTNIVVARFSLKISPALGGSMGFLTFCLCTWWLFLAMSSSLLFAWVITATLCCTSFWACCPSLRPAILWSLFPTLTVILSSKALCHSKLCHQLFYFICATNNCFLLTAMQYEHYVAVCTAPPWDSLIVLAFCRETTSPLPGGPCHVQPKEQRGQRCASHSHAGDTTQPSVHPDCESFSSYAHPAKVIMIRNILHNTRSLLWDLSLQCRLRRFLLSDCQSYSHDTS